jgi:hypothetical protein
MIQREMGEITLERERDPGIAQERDPGQIGAPAGPRIASSPAKHLLTLAAGLGAALPVILSTVHAVGDGWVPEADQAIIATRAHDVLTWHMPLVGQYTIAGHVTGHVTHSLGPMLFWLLALPARFGSPASLAWTMGAVNTLAIVGSVALARRRGGLVLMFATAIAIALMCQSLAAETFHDVWNPSAGLFPFTLLIFLCWSLACGDYRLLPLVALVASFVVQAHLMYLPATVGLVAVGLGGLIASVTFHARRVAASQRPMAPAPEPPSEDGPAPPTDHNPKTIGGARERPNGRAPTRRMRGSLLRWGIATVLVLAFCWSAPVVDEVANRPGNLTLVVNTATQSKPRLGADVGWHAVVRAVGAQPWWLYIPRTRWDRKYDVRSTPSPSAVDWCLALLSGLLVVMLAGVALRRLDLTTAALIGLVLCAALAAVAASTPTTRLLSATLGYTMWWGTQVGMWVWLILAWSIWLALSWIARAALSAHRARRAASSSPIWRARRVAGVPVFVPVLATALACAAGLAATAAIGSVVASSEKPDEHRPSYRPATALAQRLERVIPSGQTIQMVGNLNVATMPIKPALRYYLVGHGVRVLARGSNLRLGNWYELFKRPYEYMVYLDDGSTPPARGVVLVDRVAFIDGWGRQLVSLWLSPVARHRRPPIAGSTRA